MIENAAIILAMIEALLLDPGCDGVLPSYRCTRFSVDWSGLRIVVSLGCEWVLEAYVLHLSFRVAFALEEGGRDVLDCDDVISRSMAAQCDANGKEANHAGVVVEVWSISDFSVLAEALFDSTDFVLARSLDVE